MSSLHFHRKEQSNKNELGLKITMAQQFTILFICAISALMIGFLCLNSFFMPKYYLKHRITNIKEAYENLNQAVADGSIDSGDFTDDLLVLCNRYNIDVVIVDEDSETVLSSLREPAAMIRNLLDNVFLGENSEESQIEEETGVYTLERYEDSVTKLHYMSMWGVLDNGNLFMIRSAIESIQDSVRLMNRLMIHLGVFILLLGTLVSLILSRQMTAPIKELANLSKKMTALDFDTKYAGNDKNEIGILGANFNEMSETLEKTISELKTANNELQKDVQQKEEIDEMRKEFLSNVSHELKTPIALVLGYAEGLKDCVMDDDESREYYCDVIMDEAIKMDEMVKKLLMLNQLEFGNENVVMERFDIVEAVHNYIKSADILLKQKEIAVTVTSDEKAMFVWGDIFKIEEVIRNYCSNAMNHVDDQKKIKIDITRKNDKVNVAVYNSGKPIPREALPRIWDKFYKVDKARTREYGGSGVGLSIVKAVMESMNQEYGVTNMPDGVTFWFELSSV